MISNSRAVNIAIVMGVAVIAFVAVTHGEDDQAAQAQSRVTKVTSKAMDSVKSVANKGAEIVAKSADGITVRVDRIVNHQPKASNLLVNTGRGVGHLLRNYTVEAGRAINAVGSGAVNFVKRTLKATVETAKGTINRESN